MDLFFNHLSSAATKQHIKCMPYHISNTYTDLSSLLSPGLRKINIFHLLQCRKITGGDLDSLDELEQVLLSEDWWVIVATPQTVCNYFEGFKWVVFLKLHYEPQLKNVKFNLLLRNYHNPTYLFLL